MTRPIVEAAQRMQEVIRPVVEVATKCREQITDTLVGIVDISGNVAHKLQPRIKAIEKKLETDV